MKSNCSITFKLYAFLYWYIDIGQLKHRKMEAAV